MHALLGENGAGKSTLMSIISGTQTPTSGSVVVDGVERTALTPADALALASPSFTRLRPCCRPDGRREPRAGHSSDHASLGVRDGPWVTEKLAVVGCTVHPDTKCGDLPIAERQLIEIAKALATDTKVLILDEPTAPLVQDKVDLLFEQVRRFAAAGVAVVYITHRIPEVRELADTMTILRDGRVRGSYDPQSLTDDEIITLIAGRDVDAVFPPAQVESVEAMKSYRDDVRARMVVEAATRIRARSCSSSARCSGRPSARRRTRTSGFSTGSATTSRSTSPRCPMPVASTSRSSISTPRCRPSRPMPAEHRWS
ncbi:ATP-binding cassette domain-containing protein [Rhodococcus sp. B7740]|uniref:ATP-binding cassette domain-containing protein n=1 Tax=Rhodococcus sp. B7740 TaxID=1564114 RepID=UPI000698BB92|nr:ATP-binding cassette domain-containing protein [Rhodococcus sp. B7740]